MGETQYIIQVVLEAGKAMSTMQEVYTEMSKGTTSTVAIDADTSKIQSKLTKLDSVIEDIDAEIEELQKDLKALGENPGIKKMGTELRKQLEQMVRAKDKAGIDKLLTPTTTAGTGPGAKGVRVYEASIAKDRGVVIKAYQEQVAILKQLKQAYRDLDKEDLDAYGVEYLKDIDRVQEKVDLFRNALIQLRDRSIEASQTPKKVPAQVTQEDVRLIQEYITVVDSLADKEKNLNAARASRKAISSELEAPTQAQQKQLEAKLASAMKIGIDPDYFFSSVVKAIESAQQQVKALGGIKIEGAPLSGAQMLGDARNYLSNLDRDRSPRMIVSVHKPFFLDSVVEAIKYANTYLPKIPEAKLKVPIHKTFFRKSVQQVASEQPNYLTKLKLSVNEPILIGSIRDVLARQGFEINVQGVGAGNNSQIKRSDLATVAAATVGTAATANAASAATEATRQKAEALANRRFALVESSFDSVNALPGMYQAASQYIGDNVSLIRRETQIRQELLKLASDRLATESHSVDSEKARQKIDDRMVKLSQELLNIRTRNRAAYLQGAPDPELALRKLLTPAALKEGGANAFQEMVARGVVTGRSASDSSVVPGQAITSISQFIDYLSRGGKITKEMREVFKDISGVRLPAMVRSSGNLLAEWRRITPEIARFNQATLLAGYQGRQRRFGFGDRRLARAARAASYYAGFGAVGIQLGMRARESAGTAIQFEQQIAGIQSVLPSRNPRDAQQLERGIIDTAQQYGARLSEVADAARIFAQTGMSATEVVQELDVALMAMRGLNVTVEQAQELVIALRAVQGELVNTEAVFDRLSAVASAYAITEQNIIDALKIVSPVAQQYTKDIVGLTDAIDMTSALSTVAVEQLRISGNQAGNAIKFILPRITRPSNMEALQQEFGARLGDVNGELLALPDLIRELSRAYGELSDTEKKRFAFVLGGGRRINVVTALLENYDKVQEVAQKSTRSYGAAQDRAAIQMDTLATSLGKLGAALDSFTAGVLSDSGVGLGGGLKALVDLLTKGISGGAPGMLGLAAGGAGASMGVRALYRFGQDQRLINDMLSETSSEISNAAKEMGRANLSDMMRARRATLAAGGQWGPEDIRNWQSRNPTFYGPNNQPLSGPPVMMGRFPKARGAFGRLAGGIGALGTVMGGVGLVVGLLSILNVLRQKLEEAGDSVGKFAATIEDTTQEFFESGQYTGFSQQIQDLGIGTTDELSMALRQVMDRDSSQLRDTLISFIQGYNQQSGTDPISQEGTTAELLRALVQVPKAFEAGQARLVAALLADLNLNEDAFENYAQQASILGKLVELQVVRFGKISDDVLQSVSDATGAITEETLSGIGKSFDRRLRINTREGSITRDPFQLVRIQLERELHPVIDALSSAVEDANLSISEITAGAGTVGQALDLLAVRILDTPELREQTVANLKDALGQTAEVQNLIVTAGGIDLNSTSIASRQALMQQSPGEVFMNAMQELMQGATEGLLADLQNNLSEEDYDALRATFDNLLETLQGSAVTDFIQAVSASTLELLKFGDELSDLVFDMIEGARLIERDRAFADRFGYGNVPDFERVLPFAEEMYNRIGDLEPNLYADIAKNRSAQMRYMEQALLGFEEQLAMPTEEGEQRLTLEDMSREEKIKFLTDYAGISQAAGEGSEIVSQYRDLIREGKTLEQALETLSSRTMKEFLSSEDSGIAQSLFNELGQELTADIFYASTFEQLREYFASLIDTMVAEEDSFLRETSRLNRVLQNVSDAAAIEEIYASFYEDVEGRISRLQSVARSESAARQALISQQVTDEGERARQLDDEAIRLSSQLTNIEQRERANYEVTLRRTERDIGFQQREQEIRDVSELARIRSQMSDNYLAELDAQAGEMRRLLWLEHERIRANEANLKLAEMQVNAATAKTAAEIDALYARYEAEAEVRRFEQSIENGLRQQERLIRNASALSQIRASYSFNQAAVLNAQVSELQAAFGLDMQRTDRIKDPRDKALAREDLTNQFNADLSNIWNNFIAESERKSFEAATQATRQIVGGAVSVLRDVDIWAGIFDSDSTESLKARLGEALLSALESIGQPIEDVLMGVAQDRLETYLTEYLMNKGAFGLTDLFDSPEERIRQGMMEAAMFHGQVIQAAMTGQPLPTSAAPMDLTGQNRPILAQGAVSPDGKIVAPTIFGEPGSASAVSAVSNREALESLAMLAGPTLGQAIGRQGNDRYAAVGSQLGSLAGLYLGTQYGAIGGPMGMAIGGALGGLIGLFGDDEEDENTNMRVVEAIERQEKSQIQAIKDQTDELIDPQSALLNLPSTFSIPAYSPIAASGGAAANSFVFDFTGAEFGNTDPNLIAASVEDAANRAIGQSIGSGRRQGSRTIRRF